MKPGKIKKSIHQLAYCFILWMSVKMKNRIKIDIQREERKKKQIEKRDVIFIIYIVGNS